jgi:hypothetical protein
MLITIDKYTTPEEINKALKTSKVQKKKVNQFFGKLKGNFGDGLEYQKNIRS